MLIHNGDKQICRDGDPNLGFEGISRGAIEVLSLRFFRKLPQAIDISKVEFSGTIQPGGNDEKARFTETQIVGILKEADAGISLRTSVTIQ